MSHEIPIGCISKAHCVLLEVLDERRRQQEKWGEHDRSDR